MAQGLDRGECRPLTREITSSRKVQQYHSTCQTRIYLGTEGVFLALRGAHCPFDTSYVTMSVRLEST